MCTIVHLFPQKKPHKTINMHWHAFPMAEHMSFHVVWVVAWLRILIKPGNPRQELLQSGFYIKIKTLHTHTHTTVMVRSVGSGYTHLICSILSKKWKKNQKTQQYILCLFIVSIHICLGHIICSIRIHSYSATSLQYKCASHHTEHTHSGLVRGVVSFGSVCPPTSWLAVSPSSVLISTMGSLESSFLWGDRHRILDSSKSLLIGCRFLYTIVQLNQHNTSKRNWGRKKSHFPQKMIHSISYFVPFHFVLCILLVPLFPCNYLSCNIL